MRIARSTGAVSGLIILVLGVWGALIPFIGPWFNYSFGVNSAWHYTTDRLWLDIVPGAVAAIGGILLMSARTRSTAALGAWMAILAGTWFVVGPAVSLTWESGAGPIGRPLFGTTRQMLELLGYFYGLGAVILGFGAYALGRVGPRPRIAAEEPAAVERPAAVEETPAARSRLGRRRRSRRGTPTP